MNSEHSNIISSASAILVGIAAVFAFLFDYFFVWKTPGIAVPLFTALIACSLVSLTFLFKRRVPRDVIFLLALAIFFSSMVAIRANVLLTMINIVGTMLLLALVTEVNVRGSIKHFVLSDYVKTIGLPLAYLISLRKTITSVRVPFLWEVSMRSQHIIRGVVMTVPVIALFAALFAGADPVFHTLFSAIFNMHLSLPEHPYITICVFALMCGAYGYAFSRTSAIQGVARVPKRPMGHIEATILLGSVNALFIIFLALQATYIFGGIINITNDAFTYAEYARRGFFEFIAICAFTYLILLATEKLIERNTEHHSPVFKYLSAGLVMQVMVLMFFAFNRLSLYEAAFGFTTLRVYSHAFIVLLAAVYIFLLYKIVIDPRENTFALRIFCAIVLFVAGMNMLNPDAFIARKNLERFNATGNIDSEYLAKLSSDAAPVLLDIFAKTEPAEKSALGRALYDRSLARPETWQSWNLSREHEMRVLSSRQDEFVSYKDYQKDFTKAD